MLLVEFRGGVGHLRLYPDTELDAFLCGIIAKRADAVRQLVGIGLPVAQGRIVAVALILAAKPAVVHNKQFTPHHGDVIHHLVHALLSDVEIDTLPGVQ